MGEIIIIHKVRYIIQMSYDLSLFQRDRACLFKIPPLSVAKGHYLDQWKEMVWEGIVRVVDNNDRLRIDFLFKDSKKIYAQSPIPSNHQEAIQRCVDSSRGFAVRLQNPNGRYVW